MTTNFLHERFEMCHSNVELEQTADHQASATASHPARPHRSRKPVLILISCLSLTMMGSGLGFAFGVYQELYETIDGPFQDASPAAIDLIGTLSASLMTIGAPVVNILSNKYGPRFVVLLGGALFAISGIAASFGAHLWHFQLSQGVLQGCAACLTYIPAVTVSPGYFSERRALAMGIITSGTGFGGMIWAPFLRYFITAMGLRNTLRTVGVFTFGMIAISASVLEDTYIMESTRATNDEPTNGKCKLAIAKGDLVRSLEFISHASGTALQAAAYMIPMYFMSSYAQTLGYTTTGGANIIALSDVCNSLGKILIGYHADRLGRLNALVISTVASSVSTFGIYYTSTASIDPSVHRVFFVLYSCIYGTTAGAYVSLFPTVLVEQFGILGFSKVSGLLYMIRGFGTLLGTPLGGALVTGGSEGRGPRLSSDFDKMFLFVGFLLFGASISVMCARSLKKKFTTGH